MATNITVVLKDEPGQLAKVGETTGQAGINLLGMSALTGEGRGVINILVEDAGGARAESRCRRRTAHPRDRRRP